MTQFSSTQQSDHRSAAQRGDLDAFFERQRNKLPDFEIRVWQAAVERWEPIGYAHNRQFACILAGALHQVTGDKIQVWQIRNCLHPHLGERQLMDEFPDRFCRCAYCVTPLAAQ